jgi:hypothetical protein
MMVEVKGRKGLIAHIRKELKDWPSLDGFPDDAVVIMPAYRSRRHKGWKNVFIVKLIGYGVMGFCDGDQ